MSSYFIHIIELLRHGLYYKPEHNFYRIHKCKNTVLLASEWGIKNALKFPIKSVA